MVDEDLGSLAGKITVIARDVVNDNNPLRHDPDKLAELLLEIARRPRTASQRPINELELAAAG